VHITRTALILLAAVGAPPQGYVSPEEFSEMLTQTGMSYQEFRDFAKQCEGVRKSAIRSLTASIAEIQSTPVPSKDRDQKLQAIKTLKAYRASIDNRTGVAYPPLDGLHDGAIGSLPGNHFKVLQIVGKDSMRVELSFAAGTGEVLLRGVPTNGLSDESHVTDIDCYRIDGSQSYTTVLGATRTVLVLKPFDTKPIARYLKLLHQKPPAKKAAAP
jgi:hypothetical protein